MTEGADPSLLQGVKRKRPRAARACQACRAKKYRCDELYPCGKCSKHKVDCIYDVADAVRQRLVTPSHSGVRSSVAPFQQDSINGSPITPERGRHLTGITQNADTQRTGSGDHGEDGQVDEVSDVNRHTQNPEFHGKTSSLAFLATLQPKAPMVSRFHNEAFSPEALTQVQPQDIKLLEHDRYYFRQAHAFLDGYFQNLHFIHPILDRREFMSRCEDLWFGKAHRQPRSFVALYYSIMSLGALIRTWDEDEIEGMGRLNWSRRLFNLARIALESLKNETSVESVQCLFFMAKVSQNELNPSLAYMYLGWATRACFSAGFNRRRPSAMNEMLPEEKTISKLFWGLYSLETETSFALGRPDGLGADAYHNRPMPNLDEGETAIITVMVHFSRIVKDVAQTIYLSDVPVEDKAERAVQLELKMHTWLQNLPEVIRPPIFGPGSLLKIAKDPLWAKRQRLVLELRFYNVKMVLFKPFLASALKSQQPLATPIREAVGKCVDAARATIELMHDMYCHHIFFRTWWYNTTYVSYAASIVLCYGTRMASREEQEGYLALGSKTVEILEAMEESVVAKNSAQMVRQIIASAEKPAAMERSHDSSAHHGALPTDNDIGGMDLFPDENLAAFLDLDSDLDLFSFSVPLNGGQLPYWNDFGAGQD